MSAAQLGFEEEPWMRAAPLRLRALRRLLADKLWHSADEMRLAAGWRYGARLYELRRGEDGGPPLVVQVSRVHHLAYRQVSP